MLLRILAALVLTIPGVAVSAQSASLARPVDVRMNRAQFEWFAHLEGRWRGTGTGGLAGMPAFFEEYARLDDSTFAQRTLADQGFAKATDSTRIAWRGGRVLWVQSVGNPLVASRIDGDSAVFEQQSGAPITVRRTSPDHRRGNIPRGPGGLPSSYEMTRQR
jgi:hypothetical protein